MLHISVTEILCSPDLTSLEFYCKNYQKEHRHSEPEGRRNPGLPSTALDSYALRALNDGDNNKHPKRIVYTSAKIENSVIELAN